MRTLKCYYYNNQGNQIKTIALEESAVGNRQSAIIFGGARSQSFLTLGAASRSPNGGFTVIADYRLPIHGHCRLPTADSRSLPTADCRFTVIADCRFTIHGHCRLPSADSRSLPTADLRFTVIADCRLPIHDSPPHIKKRLQIIGKDC